MGPAPEPADAILELILRLEQEAREVRRRLGKSLRRLGIDPETTMARLGDTLRALGAEAPPLIEHPDYEVRVIPPIGRLPPLCGRVPQVRPSRHRRDPP